MAAGNVPNGSLSPLYDNTTPGVTAGSAVLDAAIIAIVQTVNDNWQAFYDFLTGPIIGVPDQSITSAKIRDLAITTLKLAELAVTTAKIADLNVTTAKLADLAVTAAKIANATITEPKYESGSVSNRALGPYAVKIGNIDPTLIGPISDAGVQARFNTIDERLKDLGLNVKNFGAIGDGSSHPLSEFYPTLIAAQVVYPHAKALTDNIDWCAIQSAINYAQANGLCVIHIPKGNYSLSYPLLVYVGISLIGDGQMFDVTTKGTRLFKSNHTTLNDGTLYAAIDALIIVTNNPTLAPEILKNHGISSIWVDGIIDFNTADFNAFGVYSAKLMEHFIIEKAQVGGDIGIRFDAGLYQCTFRSILITPWSKGFSMGSSGSTSTNLESVYVLNCRKDDNCIAFELRGKYSFGNNLACDTSTGILYSFFNAEWTISGVGCESSYSALRIIKVDGTSNVTINGGTLFGTTIANSSVIEIGTNAKLTLTGSTIGDRSITSKVSLGCLYKMGYNCELKLIDNIYWNTYTVQPINVDINNSFVQINAKGSTEIGLYGGESPSTRTSPRQYIGSLKPIDAYNPTQQLSPKAIFLQVDNPFRNIDAVSYAGSAAVPVGTVFLTNDPKKYGCAGWVCISIDTGDNANYLYGCNFAAIPIVLSGTTAERPVLVTITIGPKSFKSLTPSQPYGDSTLNKMIFRNFANTGWMLEDGTAV